MKQLRWIAIPLLCLLLVACLPQEDQAALQTRAAEAGQTALAEGKSYVETRAPELKDTAVAGGKTYLETQVPELKDTVVAGGKSYLETQVPDLKETAAAELATQVARQFGQNLQVALDPGHGWLGDSGAVGHGMLEKDLTLDIAFRTKAILEGQGFTVYMTRTGDDMEHGLAHAAEAVNQHNPDVAVSIHANAGNGTGTEACYTVGKATDAESLELANLLTDSVARKLSLKKRGVFPENAGDRCARKNTTGWNQLYIHEMMPPVALVELAFIDNAQDAELLRTRRQDFAQAIADAIVAYFETE